MKKLFAVALLATALHAAWAAGPYDGIYQQPNTQNFLSVHQSGSTIIATNYSNIAISGVGLQLGSAQYLPSVMDYFSVYSGAVNGNSTTVSGFAAFRACNVTYSAVFSATGLVATVVSATTVTTTPGVSCAALYPPGTAIPFSKIFG